jgi:hypothetical protein
LGHSAVYPLVHDSVDFHMDHYLWVNSAWMIPVYRAAYFGSFRCLSTCMIPLWVVPYGSFRRAKICNHRVKIYQLSKLINIENRIK